MKIFRHRWAPLVAFVLLALVFALAVNISAHQTAKDSAEVVYSSQIDSCHRGNNLRVALNKQIQNDIIERNAVIQFLAAATIARQQSYSQAHHKTDLVAAQQYSKLADQVRATVNYKKLPLTKCRDAIKKP